MKYAISTRAGVETRRGSAPAPATEYTATGSGTFLSVCSPSGVVSIPDWLRIERYTSPETHSPPPSESEQIREAMLTPSPETSPPCTMRSPR